MIDGRGVFRYYPIMQTREVALCGSDAAPFGRSARLGRLFCADGVAVLSGAVRGTELKTKGSNDSDGVYQRF